MERWRVREERRKREKEEEVSQRRKKSEGWEKDDLSDWEREREEERMSEEDLKEGSNMYSNEEETWKVGSHSMNTTSYGNLLQYVDREIEYNYVHTHGGTEGVRKE